MRNAVTINTGNDEEHIVSVILHGRPEQRVVIEMAMDTLPGVERVVQDAMGKYVLVISAPTARQVMQQIEALQAVAGVLSATMVAHYTEEAEFLNQEIEWSSLLLAQADTELSNTELPNTDRPNIDLPNTDLPNTDLPNTDLPNTELSNIIARSAT